MSFSKFEKSVTEIVIIAIIIMALRWVFHKLIQGLGFIIGKSLNKATGGENKKGTGFNERFLK